MKLLIIFLMQIYFISAANIIILRSRLLPADASARSAVQFDDDELKAISFLKRYGYLPSTTARMPLTRARFIDALNNYQVMANLPTENRLDRSAMTSMTDVRCANADVDRNDDTQVARYEIFAPRWRKANLTYRISKYPVNQPHLTRLSVDNAFKTAMQMWSNYSHIDFQPINDDRRSADIDIKFERTNYDTTCDIYFTAGELAHATMTRNPAKVHFNGRVTWRIGLPLGASGVDLVAVAAHEIGHVLGLDHSSDRNALMYAKYRRGSSGLGRDDILAVQNMYGARRPIPDHTPRPDDDDDQPTNEPELRYCPRHVTRKMPDGRRNLCAAVYIDRQCGGRKLSIADGEKSVQLSRDWDNEISSAEVNPGCTLTVCHRRDFGGGCTELAGEGDGHNFNRLPLGYDDLVTSLACVCEESNVEESTPEPIDSDESTTRRSTPEPRMGWEPPPFIPNTENTPTCAVLMTGTGQTSTKVWIEVETVMKMPTNLQGTSYGYMATRRGCSLYYCTKRYFGGVCELLGPSKHSTSTDGFEIESLNCMCK